MENFGDKHMLDDRHSVMVHKILKHETLKWLFSGDKHGDKE